MALSDANCRQWRLMTGAKHGTIYHIVRGTASLQTGCCAPLCYNACDGHKCKPRTGTPIHFSDLLVASSWHFGVALVRRRPLSGPSEWGEAAIFSLIAGCAYLFVKL